MLKKIVINIYQMLCHKRYVPGVTFSGDGSNVSLAKKVTFGGNVFIFGTAPVKIGENTMIAYGVIITLQLMIIMTIQCGKKELTDQLKLASMYGWVQEQ